MKMWNNWRCETRSVFSVSGNSSRMWIIFVWSIVGGIFPSVLRWWKRWGSYWWRMVNGEWWCLARMYIMTRWWMEVPKLTRCCCCCCCYGEIEGEWPDLNRGRTRRGELKCRNVCMRNNVGGWERKLHKEAEKVGIGNGRYLLRECVEWWLSCVIMEIVWIFGASSCNAVWLHLWLTYFTCGGANKEVEHLYIYGGVDERWAHAGEVGLRMK